MKEGRNLTPVVDDQYSDASKARLIWGSSRHHGCAN